jgi:peptidoglycan/xylan/chitin deacetylase (PgdA/CDA1 family)
MSEDTDPSAAPAAWRPPPVVWMSLTLHALAAAALATRPGLWPWALGAVAANHLLLAGAVLFPRGSMLGANLVRLPEAACARNEVSLTFDDGPDPDVTPRVLEILDRHHARASFFCIGEKARAWPRIVQRGYDAVDGNPLRVLRRLARGLGAGDVLVLHDGGGARTRDARPVVLEVLPVLLERIAARGLKAVTLPAACRDGREI